MNVFLTIQTTVTQMRIAITSRVATRVLVKLAIQAMEGLAQVSEKTQTRYLSQCTMET